MAVMSAMKAPPHTNTHLRAHTYTRTLYIPFTTFLSVALMCSVMLTSSPPKREKVEGENQKRGKDGEYEGVR